jgi:hypothetical protein
MKTERCREWRHSLGAYVLGHLPEPERAGLEAHLDGCPSCRAEADSLGSVAHLLPLADPAHIERPAPQPPADLGERIAATIKAERRAERRRRQRRRFGFSIAGAAAAAAAVLALVVLPGRGGEPQQHIEFTGLPTGVHIGAVLEPHSYGTEIHMYVSGMPSGTLCRVFLRERGGTAVPAGTFRYRWGDDSSAVLSSALDLSRTGSIGVRVGNRTFSAPVDVPGATAGTSNSNQEEAL